MGLFLLPALLGCATITSGGSHDVNIAVEPRNALVVVKDHKGPVAYSGRPGRITLKRGKDYSVTISRPGFEETVIQIPSGLNGWTFVNIVLLFPVLVGGLVGIDALSGGLWSMNNDDIHVYLEAKDPSPPSVAVPPSAMSAPLPATPAFAPLPDAGAVPFVHETQPDSPASL